MSETKIFSTTFCGRPFSVEIGKYAFLAGGACMVRYGETVVMASATASAKPREGIDYFPLSVDYDEKLYSVGKIPGNWQRREGRPSEAAVLASRVIDRPLRPLFPKDMRNDCAVVLTVMSVDPDCTPEITAMVGASLAISISDIPWSGPISGVSAGYVNGQVVLNPTAAEREISEMEVTVASSANKVVMIEAGAKEVSNEIMLEGIRLADIENKRMVEFINEVKAAVGKPKFEVISLEPSHELFDAVKEACVEDVRYALDTDDKNVREERMNPIRDAMHERYDEVAGSAAAIDECIYKIQKYVVRRWLLDDGKRVDGRGLDDMRPLHAEVAILPRTHGTGLFSRGQTQALTVATLAPIGEKQLLDGIDGDESKRYMHHYNMPSYSTGETKASRGPGRREIGHGALGERALLPVLPSEDDFPYTIRLVSEILSSNGSTSQASICGSTLALMDAGVPITAPVAGISCGLITEGERWMTMVDIQGVEDFFGDMDFKVAGTLKGITAIQMDLKIDGLTFDIIKEALDKTLKARTYIINEVILKCIDKPRDHLSPYAPKMATVKINPDKIREVIGSGGKVIQKICADCDVKIDVEDDGRVAIFGINIDNVNRALEIVKTIAFDPEIGAIYKGKVTRLMQFGAFVEIAPGKEGLVHISKLDFTRVEKVEDVVNVGDEVVVKVTEIDDQGRLNLSRVAAIAEIEGRPLPESASAPRPPRRDNDFHNRGPRR